MLNDISYSVNVRTTGRAYRFAIITTTLGFTIVDRVSGDVGRTHTYVGAKVWAGIRVDEMRIHKPSKFDLEA